nr:hypothetical protein [uncultured Flavobacterium sp.]
MSDEIFYKVEGTLYRNNGEETNLVDIDETFEDNNPIVAREKAFSYCQSYVDVLLQSKGEEYVCYEKAVTVLTDFFRSGRKHQLLPDLVDMDDTSLSVFMVKRVPETFQVLGKTHYQNRWQIHSMDSEFEDWSASILKSLMYEYSIYEKNGYDCKNYVVTCDTLDYFTKRTIQRILETPRFIDEYLFL